MSVRVSMRQRNLEEHLFEGFRDISRTILSCRACGEKLIEVKLVNDQVDVTLRYQATCWVCGGSSPPAAIEGKVLLGRQARTVILELPELVGDLQLIRTAQGPFEEISD